MFSALMFTCALRARCVPEPIITLLLESGYEATSAMLVPPLGVSPAAHLEASVRQGAVESPGISLFVLDGMLTKLELHPYEMLSGTLVPSQGFADDTALVCSSRAALQHAVCRSPPNRHRPRLLVLVGLAVLSVKSLLRARPSTPAGSPSSTRSPTAAASCCSATACRRSSGL